MSRKQAGYEMFLDSLDKKEWQIWENDRDRVLSELTSAVNAVGSIEAVVTNPNWAIKTLPILRDKYLIIKSAKYLTQVEEALRQFTFSINGWRRTSGIDVNVEYVRKNGSRSGSDPNAWYVERTSVKCSQYVPPVIT